MNYSPLEVAQAALDAGQVDEALNLLNGALRDAPHDADALRLRAALLARLPGRESEALRDLERLAAPTPDALRLRARLLRQTGDLSAARGCLERLWEAERDPRDAETLLRLLLESGQAGDALHLLGMLPAAWTWDIWRGDAHAALGDRAAARRCYRTALDALPDSPLSPPLRAYLRDRIAEV
ncbi:MAG: tetratricopeptide repeat protein [Anaerolineae bacterium]|nr:tetratricopeptide repeat protein [Anaerolineae bacterium]